ncbi:MAG: hypothetical protein KIT45_15235 [Fimbriimonadia bacterium]|nr:hypothetical protein [Fimbriimonadia bacterium]
MKLESDLLKSLSQATQLTEPEITARAIQVGLRQLWREWILSRYLHGEMSREAAIEEIGIDYVELAERQSQAAKEDIEWAMNG